MTEERRFGILVAVDDSPAAGRALQYVARVVGARDRFRVHLLHMLPPLPPGVLEHGGAERPADEAVLEAELQEKREQALSELRHAADPLFDRARSILNGAGFEAHAVSTECRESVDHLAIARECIESANEHECGTIAIGRDALPRFKELLHRHVAEELVKHGAEHTIWVVE
jgi:nucleotide-binding universal stress UspA family protein